MTKRNEAIGTVECPTKSCSERCDVFRFRERGESEKSVANRRFAGKLYGRCPKHGQFGGGAGDSDMQEYILCHASMHAPTNVAGDRQPSPATTPAKKMPATPAKAPASPVVRQASSSPASARESPERSSESPAKEKPDGWGFFE